MAIATVSLPASGTGKTVTLQVMAESFSRIGVPVFAADIKGDLSGISEPGKDNPKITARVKEMKLTDFAFGGCPVTFWDVFGEEGHPIRATVSGDVGRCSSAGCSASTIRSRACCR